MPFQITLLEGQKEEIQVEFKLAKKKLDETEKCLRETDADRGRLKERVDTILHRVGFIHGQLGVLNVRHPT